MKPQSLPIPSRENTSHGQLNALLVITQALQPYLILPPADLAGNPPAPQLDGGTVAAAAATFIKTCARIDELLADNSRWSLETQDALYDALIRTQEFQQQFLKAQTAGAEAITRPSFLHKPMLVLVENGYAAVYGDLTTGANIVGYGVTPEAAFADFDAAWNRKAIEQNVIAPIAPSPEPAPEVKPKRKKK
jgi:hypothetical protein